MSHPRGGWAPRGRGGYHAGPVFQAKRWVKPGSAAAVAAEAAEAAEAAAVAAVCRGLCVFQLNF